MLEYEAAKERYHPTPEDRSWLVYRLGYSALQLLLLLVIVYRVGPNLFLFDTPFTPGPLDYVRYTTDYVPAIAAIQAYQRDFGKLPVDTDDLAPEYLPADFKGGRGEINGTTSITFPVGNHGVLEYEFSPTIEGWMIHSPRYNGRIPAPIVPAAPKPTTRSSSNPTSTAPNAR